MKIPNMADRAGTASATGGNGRFNATVKMPFQISSNLSEQIAEHITDKIIRMEIRPGERIMETSIAEELAVSRSPIREALRILERNRLVELIPRRGARVTELSETFVSHLCDVLAALLSLTARESVRNGSGKDLNRIDQAAHKAAECVAHEDLYGYYTSVFEFAVACLKATHNPLLEQMVFELMPNVRRVVYASLSTKKEALQRNVQTVLTGNQYVQERNGKMAEKTVCDYIQQSKEFALKNQMVVSIEQTG
jgi:DNA-binding GntR family transcriptional regulator